MKISSIETPLHLKLRRAIERLAPDEVLDSTEAIAAIGCTQKQLQRAVEGIDKNMAFCPGRGHQTYFGTPANIAKIKAKFK